MQLQEQPVPPMLLSKAARVDAAQKALDEAKKLAEEGK